MITIFQKGNFKSQPFQDHHILTKSKWLEPCPFMTTTSSHNQIYPKALLLRPSHSPKVEIVTNQSFQGHNNFPKKKNLKPVISRPPWHPKVKKLSKISPYKTTTPSQSKNYQNQSFYDNHTLQK